MNPTSEIASKSDIVVHKPKIEIRLVNKRQKNSCNNSNNSSPTYKPRRYVTLDFLRGFAILSMLAIHLLTRIMDLSWTYELEKVPVFFIILTITLVYLGSWRGLFVIISGIGHMIAMQRARKKGVPLWRIVTRQVSNGVFLLVFAMLTEGFIGYDGWLNRSLLNGSILDINYYLGRLNHFHTIHCISWCLIINGILYGLIMWKNNYKKITQVVIIYAILAITIFSITTPVWNAIDKHSFTDWLTGDSLYALKSFFSAPLAGQPQPLLPYLSSLFIGNIIGLYLELDKPPKNLPQIFIIIGFLLIIIGIILGIAFNATFNDWLPLRNPERLTKLTIWYPWYLFGLGGELIVIMILFRFIEYRGKGSQFAQRTKFVRRFGVVPFSVYTFQWFELLPRWIISGLILGLGWTDSVKVTPIIYLTILFFVLIMWYFITLGWEQIHFIGSFEWIISRIVLAVNTIGKRNKSSNKTKIMGTSKRNMKDLIHNVTWIDLSDLYETKTFEKKELNLKFSSSVLGLFFFPFIFISACLLGIGKVNCPVTKKQYKLFFSRFIYSYALVQFLVISFHLLTLKGLSI